MFSLTVEFAAWFVLLLRVIPERELVPTASSNAILCVLLDLKVK